MKRTITKRSAEELEKFFKKSSNKAVIDNLNEQKIAKKPVSLHQIIENAVMKLDKPIPLEFKLDDDDSDLDLDLDDIPMDFEEEE
jgi:hypothetical protein